MRGLRNGRLKICLVLTVALGAAPLTASELASVTLSATPINPTTFQYDVVIHDIGTTNIGTLWMSWVPGQDYMSVSPTNVVDPAGWVDNITHAGAGDGFAIQWVANPGPAVTPGNSLSGFSFDSTETPAQLNGPSAFFGNPPTLTSFVYSGVPFSDAGAVIVAQVSPEPVSTLLMAGGVALLGLTVRKRRSSRR